MIDLQGCSSSVLSRCSKGAFEVLSRCSRGENSGMRGATPTVRVGRSQGRPVPAALPLLTRWQLLDPHRATAAVAGTCDADGDGGVGATAGIGGPAAASPATMTLDDGSGVQQVALALAGACALLALFGAAWELWGEHRARLVFCLTRYRPVFGDAAKCWKKVLLK